MACRPELKLPSRTPSYHQPVTTDRWVGVVPSLSPPSTLPSRPPASPCSLPTILHDWEKVHHQSGSEEWYGLHLYGRRFSAQGALAQSLWPGLLPLPPHSLNLFLCLSHSFFFAKLSETSVHIQQLILYTLN